MCRGYGYTIVLMVLGSLMVAVFAAMVVVVVVVVVMSM
jgi:hypothetical protein